ncbi:MAG: ATP-dependent DNA helicase [Candidatus Dojkabacteria bacterium]
MQNIDHLLEKLNPQQRKAVETVEGPVLVVAGPGTGKTQVLTLRIANILQKTDANASNILCLTFTESGVTAMRRRLLEMIGNDAYYVRIHTFHSFCNEVIQTFPEEFMFSKELTQLDDLNRLKLLREAIDKVEIEVGKSEFKLIPFRDKYSYIRAINSSIQTLKREGVTPETLEKNAQKVIEDLESNTAINKKTGKPTGKWDTARKSAQKNLELSRIYKTYSALLTEKGFYDYEDMILFVLEKFKTNPDILSSYQEKYLYILVDEYQDTNGAQNEILKYLGNFDSSPNIFAVGDDDQAIYRFQGANVENLLFFEKQFQNVQTIPITENYRSSQNILDLASGVIENNKARLVNYIPYLNKKLKAAIEIPNHKAQILEFNTSDGEIAYIVDKIKELQSQGIDLKDVAIIYRNHSNATELIEALVKENIPLQVTAGKNATDNKVVEQFIDLLKTIEYTNKDRDFLLFKVLFFNFLNFDRLDIFKITRIAGDEKLSIFDLLTKEEFQEKLRGLNLKQEEDLKNFALKIANWKGVSSNLSITQFLEVVGSESGFIDYVFKKTDKNETSIENINSVNSFFSYTKDVNKLNKKISLAEFLSDLTTLEEEKMPINEKDLEINRKGVNLLTAHKSKGLEFKHVFIIKFVDKTWGGAADKNKIKLLLNTDEDPEEIDEIEDERRLFFVALTRAKEFVYITYAQSYPSGNSTTQTSPSQFLAELPENLIEKVNTQKYEEIDIERLKNILKPAVATNYSISEEEYLKYLISNFKLSASALNEYIECPLKFKFNRLLKVPKFKDKSIALGNAMHFALEHFYRSLIKGDEKDNNYLKFLFQQQLERELLGPEDFESVLIEGNKIIDEYYNFYKGTFVKPIEVEYGFYGRNLLLEIPGIDAIPLSGKMDKIEPLEKDTLGQVTKVKVIDYKTKVPESENSIRGLTKNSKGNIFRQLVFYKLLAECDEHFRSNINSSKYEVQQAEVDFLKPQPNGQFKRVSLEITNEDVNILKEKIKDVITKIRNLEFSGTEEYPLCRECEYCSM